MKISVRPINRGELDRIPLRCWPGRKAIDRLFSRQGTIGMAAWDGDTCVAQLHCYRIEREADLFRVWPEWNRPWWREAIQSCPITLPVPLWCHACCHVGRTQETFREEMLRHALFYAGETNWSVRRTLKKLNELDAVFLTNAEVRTMLEELRETGRLRFKAEAPEYRGKGIGAALCKESIRWAAQHGYAAVVGMGAPPGFRQWADRLGHLPWPFYSRLGFDERMLSFHGEHLFGWEMLGSNVLAAVMRDLAAGRPQAECCERLMILTLAGGDRRAADSEWGRLLDCQERQYASTITAD